MNLLERGLGLASMLTLVVAVEGQCPGVRPAFSWASSGSSIAFTDQTEAQTYISGRQWQFGDGSTSDALAVTHTYDTAAASTVTLNVFSEGCEFSTSALVVHAGANDACNSQITSAFSYEASGNNHLVFTDQSQGNGSFLFYLWTFGDDSVSSDQDTGHFYVLPGAYDVSHSIATVDSLFQTACVAGSAQKVFVDGNTSTCDSSLFLNLDVGEGLNPAPLNAEVVLFNEDLTILDWYWDYGDATAYWGASLDHYYVYPGEYQLCVQVTAFDSVAGDSCFARTCATLVSAAVSVVEQAAPADLRAWPIPLTDELWLAGNAVRRGARWRLLDALGREALTGVVAHDGQDRIGTTPLQPGVYTLVLADRAMTRSLRLLKQ
jgi:PKD repeat protein